MFARSDSRPGEPASPGSGSRAFRRPANPFVLAIGLFLVVAIAVGGFASFERFEQEREDRATEAREQAVAVAARLDQFFDSRIEVLKAVTEAPVVQGDDLVAIKDYFERVVARDSSFTGGLALINRDGETVVLSGTPILDPPVDVSDRDYVRAVLATQSSAFGNAITGRVSGDPLLTFAAPAFAANGELAWIVAGTIRLDLQEGGLATIGASMPGTVVLDGAGQVVVDRGTVARPLPANQQFVDAVAVGEAGFSQAMPGPDGTGDWLAGYARVGTSGWHAVVLRDRDAAFADARRALFVDLGALALLGLLGMAIAIAGGQRLNRAAMREHAETQAAQEREAFLRAFADALPVVAGTLDGNLRTLFANRSLRDEGAAEFVELVHPADRPGLPSRHLREPAVALDVRLRDAHSPDGFRWHRARFVDAPDLPGVRWFFAAADIDDEKRAELGLKRDIQQRDEFLGLVSHELRTPLTVLVGVANTLTRNYRGELTDTIAESLEEIEQNARRLQRLLENMLVLSQASALETAPAMEPQLLARLVERTGADFRGRYPHARLDLNIEPGLPIVLANATFVDQILWNLLTNALKYGDRDESIVVRAARRDPETVEVSVTDRGPGLPPDELVRVFEPHFRSRSAETTANGLGLGLTVCRRLVELQGGTIEASAAEGGGMRFAFTLPVLGE